MRAYVIDEYGEPSSLRLDENAPDPKVGPDSILIRTKAVSVNPVDWKVVSGYLDGAFPAHFPLIPCWDVAGVVEKVGPAIVDFQPGDEVIAYNRQDTMEHGTLAELVSAPFRCVGHKPADLAWHEAAALPLVGLTAEQTLIATGAGPGDTVLILNGAGGVGGVAIQLAVRRGAKVIATASPKNHQYIRSLGAEPVQYGASMASEVQVLAPSGVDVVLDYVGRPDLEAAAELLTPDGRLSSIVESKVSRELGGTYNFVHPDSAMLTELAAIAAAGQLRMKIAEIFPFDKAADALTTSKDGHVRGKVVIDVS